MLGETGGGERLEAGARSWALPHENAPLLAAKAITLAPDDEGAVLSNATIRPRFAYLGKSVLSFDKEERQLPQLVLRLVLYPSTL